MSEQVIRGESGREWRYDTANLLGAGGFGAVYEGLSDEGDLVAIKKIETALAGVDADKLKREVEIAARLKDEALDHVVPVLDVAYDRTDLYLVMPKAKRSLRQRLAMIRGGTPEGDAVGILKQIVRGLREIHERGVLHRDLKPENVLLVDGRWQLADFGLARDIEVGTQLLTFKMGAGTPHYMAPEMWEFKSPQFQTDLYAFGCLAYELLVAATPFAAASSIDELRTMHLMIAPDVSGVADAALRALITKLLHKPIAMRPPDARKVEELLEGTCIPLTPIQEEIRELAAADDERIAHEAAVELREFAQWTQLQQFRDAAWADLRAIFEQGLEVIRMVLPEAGIRVRPKQTIFLFDEKAQVDVAIWDDPGLDSVLHAGVVTVRGPSNRDEPPAANLVAERSDGAIRWMLYGWRAQGHVPADRYPFGPPNRTHGMPKEVFPAEFVKARAGLADISTVTTEELTPDAVAGLFRAGLALG